MHVQQIQAKMEFWPTSVMCSIYNRNNFLILSVNANPVFTHILYPLFMHYQFLQILVNTVFYWRTALFVYVLAEYFSSVFTQEDTTNVPVLEGNPPPEIPPIHIHSDGVSQLLHNLKPTKGPDNLPSYFLKR